MQNSVSYNSDPDIITLNNTPVTAMTLAVPDFNTARIKIEAMARGLSDGASAMWSLQGCVKRVSGGNVAAIPAGAVQNFAPRKDAGAAAWDISFSISGGNINVIVTGDSVQRTAFFFTVDIVGFWGANNGGI